LECDRASDAGSGRSSSFAGRSAAKGGIEYLAHDRDEIFAGAVDHTVTVDGATCPENAGADAASEAEHVGIQRIECGVADVEREREYVKGSESQSRRTEIFVNQPAQTIASHDPSIDRTRLDVRTRGLRWSEPQPSVRTMAVVMIHEDGDRSFEKMAIQDE
jgi:hypothetical protein